MKKNKLLAPILTLGSSTYWGTLAFAEVDTKQWLSGLGGVSGDLAKWLPGVINLAIGLAALVSVAVLIGAGYMYITAAGDEGKVEKATKAITYAIVGLVVCFISVILVQFVLTNVLTQG